MSGEAANPPPDRASVEAGERLRKAREAKGLAVKEAAERLHLDPWAIEALESGRFAALGPPVYVKGHLNKYAALLEFDPGSLVSAYVAQNESDPRPAPFSLSVKMQIGGGRRRWLIVVGLAVLGLLLAAGAVAGWLWMRS